MMYIVSICGRFFRVYRRSIYTVYFIYTYTLIDISKVYIVYS
nr:MAG TPA: hypothetical protein [Caudoviricetes sp.]